MPIGTKVGAASAGGRDDDTCWIRKRWSGWNHHAC